MEKQQPIMGFILEYKTELATAAVAFLGLCLKAMRKLNGTASKIELAEAQEASRQELLDAQKALYKKIDDNNKILHNNLDTFRAETSLARDSDRKFLTDLFIQYTGITNHRRDDFGNK